MIFSTTFMNPQLLFFIIYTLALNMKPFELVAGILAVFQKQAPVAASTKIPAPVVKSGRGISVMGRIIEAESNAFMRAAVKNADGAAPMLKEFAKGATETAIDNPGKLLKAVTTIVIPKMFEEVTVGFNRLIESTTRLATMIPTVPINAIASDMNHISPKNHKKILRGIANGLQKVGKQIDSIKLALLVQVNGIGMRLLSKNLKVLTRARSRGSKAMKDFLDSTNIMSFEDTAFMSKLVQENPVAMEKLIKAQRDGIIEVVEERLERSKKDFLTEVNKIIGFPFEKRELVHGRFKRNFDKVEFQNVVHEFDQVQQMLKKLKINT
jgi:hypothetical protein